MAEGWTGGGGRLMLSQDAFDLGVSSLVDCARMVCGGEIGRGTERVVYDCRFDAGLVIKVSKFDGGMYQNTVEWLTWKRLEGSPHAKWFAPCFFISPGGEWLAMRKVAPLDPLALPRVALPAFLYDHKPENFGTLDGRVVACDYGLTGMLSFDAARKMGRLRKVKWRTE